MITALVYKEAENARSWRWRIERIVFQDRQILATDGGFGMSQTQAFREASEACEALKKGGAK